MKTKTTIAVLVGVRTDPVSGRATRNRNDALAVALALQQAAPADVRLLHAGAMGDETARDYLALGAGAIELIEAAEGDMSTASVVRCLAAALADESLVLAGSRADDRHGSGVLPFALAAALGRPLIADVVELQAEGPGWIVTQALPKGARRRLRLTVPAVLAIAPNAELPLRHSYADRIAGRILRRAPPPAASAPTPTPPVAEGRVPAARRLKPLEARVAQSGHARMQAAVGGPAAAGGTVISTGSPDDKARAVLQYLRSHALVDF